MGDVMIPAANVRTFIKVVRCFAALGERLLLEVEDEFFNVRTVSASKSAFARATFSKPFFMQFRRIGRQQHCFAVNNVNMIAALKNAGSTEKSVDRVRVCLSIPQDRVLVDLALTLGVKKSYRLTYEETSVVDATFERIHTHIHIAIAPKHILDCIAHFRTGIEEVSLSVHRSGIELATFVDTSTRGVLPLSTSVQIEDRQCEVFENTHEDERVKVTFGIRELKAVLTLADALQSQVQVYLEAPGKPVTFLVEARDVSLQITLATLLPELQGDEQ